MVLKILLEMPPWELLIPALMDWSSSKAGRGLMHVIYCLLPDMQPTAHKLFWFKIVAEFILSTKILGAQSLSCVWLFATPWTGAHQTPRSKKDCQESWILEWDAISFSRGSSRLRDGTHISYIGSQTLDHWATRFIVLNVKYIAE